MFDFESAKSLISKSAFFDEQWYLKMYQDVDFLDTPPLEHFIKYGWRLGRDPGPFFSTKKYLKKHKTVAKSGVNPLCYHLQYGEKEGRTIYASDLTIEPSYKKKLSYEFFNNLNKASNNFLSKDVNKKNEAIFVGIASIPQRANALKETIRSLEHQVDKIGVFLDKYNQVPDFILDNPKVVYKISSDFDSEIGDAGKFYWVDEFEGFYFTCDDDLIYPKDYVERIINKIVSFREPVVVGWHGSVILQPFENYYNTKSRRVFSFSAPRPYDTPVHVLGTGCLGFHTSHMSVSFKNFETPNMADVYFALLGQQQQVPFIVIEHARGEIVESDDSQEYSIYKHSSLEIKDSRHNTKEKQNLIVSQTNWNKYYVKRFLKILVIGRFEINSKGGVFKSSYLLERLLKKLGHQVDICCLSKLNELDVDKDYDFCIAYAPDPDRPDFGRCIEVVEELAFNNCVCAVNFSFNLNKERTEWIAKSLFKINNKFENPKVFFASFSNSTQYLFDENVRQYIVQFPKTISLNRGVNRSYEDREGIFLGDLAKLGNESLVRGNLAKWVEQIKIKLPHVNIYALKHYHTDKVPLNYIKILPYDKNIGQVLNKFRLAVCLVPGATFEMVPLESMMSGTPVVHREMPQSLSEYLSPVSIEVATPYELGEVCKNLYERKEVWEGINSASYNSSDFFDFDNLVGILDISIRKTLVRSGVI
ncbi:hypothetical protein [Halomonas sp.]|uniref:hypothetical protein n=1 Tax=Halomonas sp. TaxID=1486246 RepID=UPI003A94A246